MKALILSFYHPDVIPGGGQQVAINLHRGLVNRKIKSTFVGFHDVQNSKYKSDATPIIKIPGRQSEYICNVSSFDSFNFLSNDVWMQKSVLSFVDQYKPTVIYVHHFLMVGIDTLKMIRRIMPGVRIVMVLHEFLSICARNGHLMTATGELCESQSPFDCNKCFPTIEPAQFFMRNSLFQSLFDSVDSIVTPSKFIHPIISGSFNVKNKLKCIPNGSFTEVELKNTQKNRANITADVGFFGQVLEDKGIRELLIAYEKLMANGVVFSLDINGSGLELNSIEFKSFVGSKIAELNSKGGKVKLSGAYKNSDVVSLMSKYKVVIFPSKWPETFSLVLTEAILSGAICIAPKIGAFTERAKDYPGKVLLYKHDSSDGMAEVMGAALNMKNNKVLIDFEKFSIEKMVQEYIVA